MVAAFLLAAGPSAAVAIAAPGDSHSGHSDGGDRSGSRGGSDYSDDNITSGGDHAPSTGGGPRTRVGSGRDVGTSDERPAADYSPDRPDRPGSYSPPKVTIGDGRTPGVQDNVPEPRWRGGAPEPAQPPPPPPPTVVVVDILPAPRTDRTPKPPIIRQLIVAPAGGKTDPLWGVAGLLLIPAAGAVLGVRQARAAQAVADLGRHP